MVKDHKQTWRKRIRLLLAEAFGGKCAICSYDKCVAALDYHHLDPSKKDKLLCVALRDGGSWRKIVEESRKCTILCCRCHRELHAGVVELPTIIPTFNESYADAVFMPTKKMDECPLCKKQKPVLAKTCSVECSGKYQQKLDWSKVDLYELLITKNMTYRDVGKLLGVSDKTVAKRATLQKIL